MIDRYSFSLGGSRRQEHTLFGKRLNTQSNLTGLLEWGIDEHCLLHTVNNCQKIPHKLQALCTSPDKVAHYLWMFRLTQEYLITLTYLGVTSLHQTPQQSPAWLLLPFLSQGEAFNLFIKLNHIQSAQNPLPNKTTLSFISGMLYTKFSSC